MTSQRVLLTVNLLYSLVIQGLSRDRQGLLKDRQGFLRDGQGDPNLDFSNFLNIFFQISTFPENLGGSSETHGSK